MKKSPTREEILNAVRANRGQLIYAHRTLSQLADTQPGLTAPSFENWSMAICAQALKDQAREHRMLEEIVTERIEQVMVRALGACDRRH
jgi:hypothetical protein